MMSDDLEEELYRVSHLQVRIQWAEDSWVSQLCYGDTMIIEGRDKTVEEDGGLAQSFLWFCEESNFLACEYKAREHALAVKMGTAVDLGVVMREKVGTSVNLGAAVREHAATRPAVVEEVKIEKSLVLKLKVWKEAWSWVRKAKDERRSLKLEFRLRRTVRGRAGVFRME